MSAHPFLSDEENLAELVSHMPAEDQVKFNNYGHFRLESAFVDRALIVYKATGLLANKRHREPQILNTVKVIDFKVLGRGGCSAIVEESEGGQRMTITHVPRKLFGYPIYVAMPARVSLRWDCRIVEGSPWRSLSFGLLIKTKNKADFYSQGNVYAETPLNFKRLYPGVTGEFKF